MNNNLFLFTTLKLLVGKECQEFKIWDTPYFEKLLAKLAFKDDQFKKGSGLLFDVSIMLITTLFPSYVKCFLKRWKCFILKVLSNYCQVNSIDLALVL